MNLLKFIDVAEAMASLSKDPSTKVAALAIDDDGMILASGYNGFPRGVDDDPALYADKEQKYARVVHAEQNLVAMAARHGIKLCGSSVLLTSLYPCRDCAKILIQVGIKKVYAPEMPPGHSRIWYEHQSISEEMFNQSGVEVVLYGNASN